MLLPVLAAARPQQSRHWHMESGMPFYTPTRGSRGRGDRPGGAAQIPPTAPGTAAYRWYQAHGRCVIDEGYGRYSFCDRF